jgi:biotin operon repressor
MANKKNQSKGIWIPEEIKTDKKLDWTNKALLSEIYSLCELPDGCIASDNHFGKLLGIGRTSVNKRVNKLEEMGYITSKNHYKGKVCIGRSIIKGSSFEKHTLVPQVLDGSSDDIQMIVPEVEIGSSVENTINTFTNSDILIQEPIHYTGETSNTGISQAQYFRNEIERIENTIIEVYSQYSFVLTMTNPDGIKGLKYHIDSKEDLDAILPLVKKLSEFKYGLNGRYS